MASKYYTHQKGKEPNDRLVYEVIKLQRKKLSYYKRRKQAGIIEDIMNDPQIMNVD